MLRNQPSRDIWRSVAVEITQSYQWFLHLFKLEPNKLTVIRISFKWTVTYFDWKYRQNSLNLSEVLIVNGRQMFFKLGVILSSLWNLIHALFWLKMLLWSICKRMRLVFSFGLLDVWLVWWWLKARTFWRYCYHFFFLMYKTRKEADRSCFLRKKSSKEVGNKQRGNNML